MCHHFITVQAAAGHSLCLGCCVPSLRAYLASGVLSTAFAALRRPRQDTSLPLSSDAHTARPGPGCLCPLRPAGGAGDTGGLRRCAALRSLLPLGRPPVAPLPLGRGTLPSHPVCHRGLHCFSAMRRRNRPKIFRPHRPPPQGTADFTAYCNRSDTRRGTPVGASPPSRCV